MKNRWLVTDVCFFQQEPQRYTNSALETEAVVMESHFVFLTVLFMSFSQIVRASYLS